MTAIDQLAAFYEDSEEFTADLHAHVLHGYCYITPGNLALARPVCLSWKREEIGNPFKIPGLTEVADCWYVWAAIGDLDLLISMIPYALPWIAFCRGKDGTIREEIKRYPFNRFHERTKSSRRTAASASGLCQGAGD